MEAWNASYFLSNQSGGGGYDSHTDDDENVNYLLQVAADFRRVGGGNGSSRVQLPIVISSKFVHTKGSCYDNVEDKFLFYEA